MVEAACDSVAGDRLPALDGDTDRFSPDFCIRGLGPDGFLPTDASSDLVSAADMLYFVG